MTKENVHVLPRPGCSLSGFTLAAQTSLWQPITGDWVLGHENEPSMSCIPYDQIPEIADAGVASFLHSEGVTRMRGALGS